MNRLSGDQKGENIPSDSVPAKGRASSESKDRIKICGAPSGPGATKANCRPSGEIAKKSGVNGTLGSEIWKRTGSL
jgi:hypothetical protein